MESNREKNRSLQNARGTLSVRYITHGIIYKIIVLEKLILYYSPFP